MFAEQEQKGSTGTAPSLTSSLLPTRMSLLALLALATLTACQMNNGMIDPNLPTVVLVGQPRVIARRIWRGREINDVINRVQAREPFHSHPVNVYPGVMPLRGRPITIYRKVIRPAKLFYTGDDVVTHQWAGGDDNNERRVFFRMPVDETRRKL